jgi:hypothetical protein
MALSAVGTETVKISKGVDPSVVVSHGAAIYARRAEDLKDEGFFHVQSKYRSGEPRHGRTATHKEPNRMAMRMESLAT